QAQAGQPLPPAVAVGILVAVDGLAEQGDLLAALGGQLADLGGDVLGRAALFGAADAGDDAVGAELVAADHDADVGLEGRRPHRRVAHRVVALEAALDLVARRLLAVEAQGELGRPAPAHLVDQLRQPGELARAADDVHVRGPAADQLLVLLGHAAEYAEHLLGVPALVGAEPAEGAVDLVLGVLADAAGVEEDHVGLGGLVRQLIPLAAQRADDQLAVEHVHLAADRLDVQFLRHVFYRGPTREFTPGLPHLTRG